MNLALCFALAPLQSWFWLPLDEHNFSTATMSVFEAMPFFGAGLFCAVLISNGFDFY